MAVPIETDTNRRAFYESNNTASACSSKNSVQWMRQQNCGVAKQHNNIDKSALVRFHWFGAFAL